MKHSYKIVAMVDYDKTGEYEPRERLVTASNIKKAIDVVEKHMSLKFSEVPWYVHTVIRDGKL